MASLTINVQGKGTVKLSDSDFVASGGEGKIYRKGKTAYKIYLDPRKMIPVAKIGELGILDRPNILRPKEILQDQKGQPIGFTMSWISNTTALCRLFTNDFRNQHGISPEDTVTLVDALQEGIVFIHDNKCLIVDGNEMNYLVDGKTFLTPYFIDVDSYQTPKFQATALMASIKDWHTKGFNVGSDWFAFGIVACQLFIGIHPYKGKHPAFKKRDMEERMKKNISIFNPDVALPAAVRDFGLIPSKIREWFIEIFEKGKRIPPPDVAGLLQITPVKAVIIESSDNFIIQRLESYKAEIAKYYSYGGQHITVTQDQLYIGKADYPFGSPDIDVIFTKGQLKPISVECDGESVMLREVGTLYDFYTQGVDKRIPFPLAATKKMIVKNTLYTIYEGKITEIVFNEFGDRILPSAKASWDIMPQSHKVFDGVIYQDVLGKAYLVIPEPEDPPVNPTSQCHVVPIPELDAYRIVNAKYDGGVCMVIGRNWGGRYDKLIFRFNVQSEGSILWQAKYSCRIIEDVDPDSLNFVVIPTGTKGHGLAISINDDGELEVFPRDPTSSKLKIIKDSTVKTSMRLAKDGTRVLFFEGKDLYSFKMK